MTGGGRSRRVPVVVIGAGQAGMAMSHHLTARSIDHVVLERGQVANSWRTERWDSLRLLSPNWMTRLPGHRYGGDDPDGFMTASQTATMIERYGAAFGAPVCAGVEVRRVRVCPSGFDVDTDHGPWRCDAVVAATGALSEPRLPAAAAALPSTVDQLDTLGYKRPDQLGPGAVLVVGASASGVQIADEVRRSGREVTISVGEHIRVPRRYRGRDIHWWLDAIGFLDERYDEVDDVARARRLPSLQLLGSPEHRDLDLTTLARDGVEVVGKLMRVVDGTAQCSGALANQVAGADLKQERLLRRIDEYVVEHELDGEVGPPTSPSRTVLERAPIEIDLSRFTTVVWATGFRPTYGWLDEAAFDRHGRLVHDGGVTVVPGLYLLGLPFMRRRKSSFIDGVGADAGDLASHLHAHLDRRCSA